MVCSKLQAAACTAVNHMQTVLMIIDIF